MGLLNSWASAIDIKKPPTRKDNNSFVLGFVSLRSILLILAIMIDSVIFANAQTIFKYADEPFLIGVMWVCPVIPLIRCGRLLNRNKPVKNAPIMSNITPFICSYVCKIYFHFCIKIIL